MKTNSSSHRHDGYEDGLTIHGRPIPYQSGVLPDDFGRRIERLKEASGLTWTGFAQAVGADRRQVLRWRKGAEPCGGAMLSLVQLALMIEGGLAILIGRSVQMSFWEV